MVKIRSFGINKFSFLLIFGCSLTLLACSKGESTDHLPPVTNFELSRYLGKWYEIARYPHGFEKDLQAVTATYTAREDGKIDVLNAGYNLKDREWEEADGVAKFKGSSDIGYLRVSFAWPFYGDYKIVELDEDYQYAIITGATDDYLWILARDPNIPADLYNQLLDKVKAMGFKLEPLIKVDHESYRSTTTSVGLSSESSR